MEQKRQIVLETGIHDLLAGVLDEAQTADLLLAVGRDQDACRLMVEVIQLQQQARHCVGLNADEATIRSSLAQTLDAIKAQGHPIAARAGRQLSSPSATSKLDWAVRIAAMVLLGTTVYLAAAADHGRRPPPNQVLIPKAESAVLADLNAEELAGLRKLWSEVPQGGDNVRPWVVMSNGVGEFGYLPTDSLHPPGDGLVLVRCVIVAQGRPATTINVLLPSGQPGGPLGGPPAQLSVPCGGRLGDQPVEIAVVSTGSKVQIDLKAGNASTGQSGLLGVVSPGPKTVEAGQFWLGNQVFKVFLQATPLNGMQS